MKFVEDYEKYKKNKFNRTMLECDHLNYPVIYIGENEYKGYFQSVWRTLSTHIWCDPQTGWEYLCNFLTAYGSKRDYTFPFQPYAVFKDCIKIHFTDDAAYINVNGRRVYVYIDDLPRTFIPINKPENFPVFSLHFQIGDANPYIELNKSYRVVMNRFKEWEKYRHIAKAKWVGNILYAKFYE